MKKKWQIKNEETLLCSYEGDSAFASSQNYPVVVSWTKSKNRTLTTNNLFLKSQYQKIKTTYAKKIINYNEKIHLLPQYTSHFGHFVGDILGAALYYAKYNSELNKNNKLLLITPSDKWDQFLTDILHDKIYLLKPIEVLNSNFLFKNTKILPQMNSIQSYLLSRNILSNEIKINNNSPKKFF